MRGDIKHLERLYVREAMLSSASRNSRYVGFRLWLALLHLSW